MPIYATTSVRVRGSNSRPRHMAITKEEVKHLKVQWAYISQALPETLQQSLHNLRKSLAESATSNRQETFTARRSPRCAGSCPCAVGALAGEPSQLEPSRHRSMGGKPALRMGLPCHSRTRKSVFLTKMNGCGTQQNEEKQVREGPSGSITTIRLTGTRPMTSIQR